LACLGQWSILGVISSKDILDVTELHDATLIDSKVDVPFEKGWDNVCT
jgi:hypothetical protein